MTPFVETGMQRTHYVRGNIYVISLCGCVDMWMCGCVGRSMFGSRLNGMRLEKLTIVEEEHHDSSDCHL